MSEHRPSAADVKALREATGAAMMDAKRALVEAEGDADAAKEILKVKGQADAAKRGGREAAEGTVQSYIHTTTGKIGAIVEVDCETDFVARNDDFVAFAKDIALHVAAMKPLYVSADEIPEDVVDAERKVFAEQAEDKPEQARPKIVEGKLRKWREGVVLLEQPHVKGDDYDGKTVEELRAELAAKTGENVVIRRFALLEVGA